MRVVCCVLIPEGEDRVLADEPSGSCVKETRTKVTEATNSAEFVASVTFVLVSLTQLPEGSSARTRSSPSGMSTQQTTRIASRIRRVRYRSYRMCSRELAYLVSQRLYLA